MNRKKCIHVLSTFIEINNDRIEGYEAASKGAKDGNLKTLFSKFVQTSRQCKEELMDEIKKLGGTFKEGTKATGKFFSIWMDVKAALMGNDSQSVLNSFNYGEDNAVDTYCKELVANFDDLSPVQQSMLKAQIVLIQEDHNLVKEMHDLQGAGRKVFLK